MFRALIESYACRATLIVGLAGFVAVAGIAPAAAQPPSSVDLNLGILSETGAIGPYRPGGAPFFPGGAGTRPYGSPDYFGRPQERTLQHLPQRPTSDWTR
jgi:hypothetical protein